MKRWISVIVLLVLIGILGTVFYYTTAPTADRADFIATSTVSSSTRAPTASASQAVATSTSVDTSADSKSSTAAGRLIMIDPSFYPDHKLVLFDLATEEVTTLFDVPENGWIYQIDVSQDGRQLAMAYSAPPTSHESQADETQADQNQAHGRQPYDRSGIYLLSLDDPAADPVLLLGNREANEYVFNPIWSPDSQSIYYVSYHLLSTASDDTPTTPQDSTLDVALYRYDLQSAENTFIAQDAVWPRLSPNGERLAYIQVDPITTERGIHVVDTNSLSVTQVVPINEFFDVDTPHFSADGQWLYFSAAPHSTKVSRTWWERLLDVKVAEAHTDHNVPSDWWRVPAEGGEPEKITSTPRLITYGEFNESGKRLFFATNMGVYTMDATGDTVEQLPLPNLYKFFVWTP
ncbi:MAG: hypothetical protein ACPGWR_10655 [Ardenticatenaceae bacterium]